MKNFSKGAKWWECIGIAFDDIKSFAYSYGAEMTIFNGWLIGLLAVIVVVPFLLFSGITSSTYDTDYTPVKMSARRSAVLYDTHNILYSHRMKNAKELAKVNKGDSLKVLAYSKSYLAFQVETSKGERGFVKFDVLGDSLVATDKVTLKNDVCNKGDKVLFLSYDYGNKKQSKTDFKLKFGEEITSTSACFKFMPLCAFGIPKYKSDNVSTVTADWVRRRFKPDITTKTDVDKQWYGYPLTVKVTGNRTVATYPLKVNDFGKEREYDTMEVLYKDGVVHSYSYKKEESMGWLLSTLPFAAEIQTLPLSAMMQSNPVTTEADINGMEDVLDEPGAVQKWIKSNFFNFKLPTWLSVIIALVLLLIGLIIVAFYFHCVLMLLPALAQFTGYIYPLPNFLWKIIITIALLFGGELLYLLAGGLNWFLVLVLLAYLYYQWKKWMNWANYARCSTCGHMYTLDSYDYRDGGTSYYDNVKYNVTTLGGKEINRKETSREHRKIVTVYEDLSCSHCGADFTYTHHNDMKA